MIKTQIQVPEQQYEALREFAKEREWSMAETFRRGAELLLEMYPRQPSRGTSPWKPPSSGQAGWRGLTPQDLKVALNDDLEPTFAHKA